MIVAQIGGDPVGNVLRPHTAMGLDSGRFLDADVTCDM